MKNLKIGIIAASCAVAFSANAGAKVSPSQIKTKAGDVFGIARAMGIASKAELKATTSGSGKFTAGFALNNDGVSSAIYPGSTTVNGQTGADEADYSDFDTLFGSGTLEAAANDAGFDYLDGAEIAASSKADLTAANEATRVGWFASLYSSAPTVIGCAMGDRETISDNAHVSRQGLVLGSTYRGEAVYGTATASVGEIAAKEYKVEFSNECKADFWNLGLRLMGGIGYQVSDEIGIYLAGTWAYTFDQKDKKNVLEIGYTFKDDTSATTFRSVSDTADLSRKGVALLPFGYADKAAAKKVSLTVNAKETFGGRVGGIFNPTDNFQVGAYVGMNRYEYSASYKGGSIAYPFPYLSYQESYLKSNSDWKLFIDNKDKDAISFSKYDWNFYGGIEVGMVWGMFGATIGAEYAKISKNDLVAENASSTKTSNSKSNTSDTTTKTISYTSPVSAPTAIASCRVPTNYHMTIPTGYEMTQSVSLEGSALSFFLTLSVVI